MIRQSEPEPATQDCTICLGPIQDPEGLESCEHLFCEKCLDQWEGPCPLCRAPRGLGQLRWEPTEPVAHYEVAGFDKRAYLELYGEMHGRFRWRAALPVHGPIGTVCSICDRGTDRARLVPCCGPKYSHPNFYWKVPLAGTYNCPNSNYVHQSCAPDQPICDCCLQSTWLPGQSSSMEHQDEFGWQHHACQKRGDEHFARESA